MYVLILFKLNRIYMLLENSIFNKNQQISTRMQYNLPCVSPPREPGTQGHSRGIARRVANHGCELRSTSNRERRAIDYCHPANFSKRAAKLSSNISIEDNQERRRELSLFQTPPFFKLFVFRFFVFFVFFSKCTADILHPCI